MGSISEIKYIIKIDFTHFLHAATTRKQNYVSGLHYICIDSTALDKNKGLPFTSYFFK